MSSSPLPPTSTDERSDSEGESVSQHKLDLETQSLVVNKIGRRTMRLIRLSAEKQAVRRTHLAFRSLTRIVAFHRAIVVARASTLRFARGEGVTFTESKEVVEQSRLNFNKALLKAQEQMRNITPISSDSIEQGSVSVYPLVDSVARGCEDQVWFNRNGLYFSQGTTARALRAVRDCVKVRIPFATGERVSGLLRAQEMRIGKHQNSLQGARDLAHDDGLNSNAEDREEDLLPDDKDYTDAEELADDYFTQDTAEGFDSSSSEEESASGEESPGDASEDSEDSGAEDDVEVQEMEHTRVE
jgi:hypothetical protein